MFGDALLSDETYESFCWMLEAFLKTHKKQPPFTVTDQDGALRKAVVKMFPESHHRLCDLAADSKFKKDFYKLVWNVYIGPEIFEQRWDDMITWNDSDKLSEFFSTVKELKKKLEDETVTLDVDPNKDALYADLLGVTVPNKVVIQNPKTIFRSKGTRRIKGAAEKGKAKTIARTNMKVPFKRRTCSVCRKTGHNKATCKGPDNEDDVQDGGAKNEGDNEDQVDEENEFDEQEESKEELSDFE
ncbi:FAR1-related sequence 5-like protein [Tanacetum coccineum]